LVRKLVALAEQVVGAAGDQNPPVNRCDAQSGRSLEAEHRVQDVLESFALARSDGELPALRVAVVRTVLEELDGVCGAAVAPAVHLDVSSPVGAGSTG